ncbi:uncharacterized protein LOC124257298 [Haliotis rubra]|uniref:uncharacterized protein LOC124257298 n=1 Tax=Haliotis rubra TaxID=36100 RepID=UPI001EE5338D|nr:uncharacterized protein LOC124257298 [Haliotis rubra]
MDNRARDFARLNFSRSIPRFSRCSPTEVATTLMLMSELDEKDAIRLLKSSAGIYSDHFFSMEESIEDAVRDVNPDRVLSLISPASYDINSNFQLALPPDIFFTAVDGVTAKPKEYRCAAQMVYLLRNIGAQINVQDGNGDTPLLKYLKTGSVQPDVVEAFLRCNADVYLSNKVGEYPLEVVTVCPDIPKSVKDVFMKYVPGIWEAVEGDDAMNVRKLINQWCRVDIEKNGKSLLQLSLDIGTESIIRVISGIRPSMEFAHGVLAGDTLTVKKLLSTRKKHINLNFRNMGDRGATPLLYALVQGHSDMVQVLQDHGARVDLGMRGDEETDIPLYFAALGCDPPISPSLLIQILPTGPINIDNLFYKGKNVLFHCIDMDVRPEVVEGILMKGSAYLVTQRIKDNITPRQYAYQMSCDAIAEVMDKLVLRWIFHENGPNRKILALHGYEYLPMAVKDLSHTESEESPGDSFFRILPIYQHRIVQFHESVEDCDVDAVRMLMYFSSPDYNPEFECCLADSRTHGEGQPPLHKAVLRGCYEIVELLAETLVYEKKTRLDSIRDQSFRTALHYAYAMENGKELVDLLLDYGASEFTMDKEGRSPLAFKDRRGQHLMEALLDYQLLQDFTTPEPDPFAVSMPIPIIGYLLNCTHTHHRPGQLTHKLAALPSSTTPRRRSLPDAKINKVISKSATIASHIASLPDTVKAKLATRAYNKCSALPREYNPLPTDDFDRYDFEEEGFETGGENDDLLHEREIKKSSSCVIQ